MKKIILFLFFVLFFSSCKKDDNPVVVPEPITQSGGLTLRDGAVQVKKEQMEKITSLTANSISFSKHNFKAGDIIFSEGYNSKAPKGFLRRVSSISGNTVYTSPASLDEAFKGSVEYNLSATSLKKSLEKEAEVEGGSFSLSYLIFDKDGNNLTLNDQIRSEGSINLSGSIGGKINISPLEVNSNFNLVMDIDLSVDVTGALTYSTKSTIFEAKGAPVVVYGVVFTPEFSVEFVPAISVGGKAKGGFKDKITLNSSLNYKSGWKLTKNFQNAFLSKEVEVSLNGGTLKGTLNFKFGVSIYELVATGVSFGPYLELKVTPTLTPWWNLYVGLGGKLYVEAKPITRLNIGYNYPLSDSQKLIASSGSANRPPDKPSNPSPVTSSQNVPSPVTLSWNCSDPDNDPLHYDLIWGVGFNTPVRIKNLTVNNYSLGTLPSNEQIFWKVIAFDSKADSTHGDLWDFRTASSVAGYPPKNPNPANNQIGVLHNNLTLSWECSDPNTPLKYDLYVGDSPSSLIPLPNLQNPYYTFASFFPPNTKAYWKVVVKNSLGESVEGPIWNFTTAGVSQSTLVLQPGPEGKDTWLKYYLYPNGDESYYNYPDTSILRFDHEAIGNHAYLSESLIQFNVSGVPSNSEIISAKLKVYGWATINSISLIPKMSLVKLISPWNENTVTWTTKPSYEVILVKEFTYEGVLSWYEMDVTSTVQSWINGDSNYGFGFVNEYNDSHGGVYGGDHENSSKRPILEITYH
ncbi:MAG: DNRLRE domain-containing protein [Nanoarchaeota archaeon]|nr:DNRLRE domain-containing protein [Nanoarchaeota archaeon]